jgi:hypothetical protein
MLSRLCTVTSIVQDAKAHLHEIAPGRAGGLIDEISVLMHDLFAGRLPTHQRADLRYHNLQHTLLATQCFVDLARGRVRHGIQPAMNGREFELGFAGIMLHDTGYLKAVDDNVGTGAKYTNTHVQRSAALAAIFLAKLGCTPFEIEGVQNAISCTGLTSEIAKLQFHNTVERATGCMVVTADYLGQMADPDYPSKLPDLFAEFEESNDFNAVPPEKRIFKSVQDLMAKTGGFWAKFVLPKLDGDYEGVYKFLSRADGVNPYLEAVERNLVRIANAAAVAVK